MNLTQNQKMVSNLEVPQVSDFFLSPEILKLGKSHPRVKMFFGDKIENIKEAKKTQRLHKKEREQLIRTHFEKIKKLA